LAKAAATVGKQRRIIYLALVSPKVFDSDQVHSFEDLIHLQNDLSVRMARSEIDAFKDHLESHGLFLRLVDKSFSSCAIVGSTLAMSAVQVVPLDAQSFLTIKDAVSGAKDIAAGIIAVGAIVATAAAAGPPVAGVLGITAANAGLVFEVGVALTALGAGILIGVGLGEIPVPANAPIQQAPLGPHDGGTSEADSVDIPDAIAIGDPPNGFDADAALTDLGNLALDLTLVQIPVGWDSDAGVALPGIGADGLGGDPDDGGGGIIDGLPV
jgi:hypothetical protein